MYKYIFLGQATKNTGIVIKEARAEDGLTIGNHHDCTGEWQYQNTQLFLILIYSFLRRSNK